MGGKGVENHGSPSLVDVTIASWSGSGTAVFRR